MQFMKSLIWGLLGFLAFFSLNVKAENMCSSVSTSAISGSLFDSGGSGGSYSSREDCSFLIQSAGATSVTLTFTTFSLETNYDYVYLYDGINTSSPQIARLTGSADGVYTANSGTMLVRFTSDGSVVDRGFSATWTAATSNCAAQSVADSFSSVSYSQNSGSSDWSGDWTEVGESDGAGAGIARVRSDLCTSGNCLRLGVPSGNRAQTFSDRGVYREADLSGVTSATLSFVYRRGRSQGSQTVVLSVSKNGGSSWTDLQSYFINSSNTSAVSASFDISAYAASNTQIRFLASGSNAVIGMYIDDINIRYQPTCTPVVQATWYFDEVDWAGTANEVLDSSGNGYHGVASKPMLNSADGVVCKAADFREDGTRDYVSLNSSALSGLNDFSVSVWGKLDSSRSGAQTIFSAASSSHTNGVLMYFSSTTSLQLHFLNTIVATYSLAAISDNRWHHYVWTRNEGQHCLFVDGVSQGCKTGTYTGVVSVSSGGLIVGQEQDSVGGGFVATQDWEGLVDEPLIFSGELSASDVRSIYAHQLAGENWDGTVRACLDVLPVPRAEWHLDEMRWSATADEIKDYSGNDFHSVASEAMDTNVDGVVCRAIDFSVKDRVTTDFISLDSAAFDGLNEFSFSVWGRSSEAGNQALLSGFGPDHGNELLLWFDRSDYFQPLVKNDSFSIGSNGFSVSNFASAANRDEWHHFVYTRKADKNCLYIDAVLQGCKSSVATGSLRLSPGSVIIGQEQDSFGGGFDISQDWDGWIDEPTIFEVELGPVQVSVIYANQKAGKNYDGSDRHCELPLPAVNYRFDSCDWVDGQNVIDSGPNRLDAYAVNGVLSTIDGQICGLAQFDSIDDYVRLPDNNFVDLPAAMTAMAWIRLNSTPTELKSAITKNTNYKIHIDSNRQVFWEWVDSNNVAHSFASGSTISVGQWQHVAVTYRDGRQVMYINGREVARQTHTGQLITNSADLQVGQDQGVAARFFDGDIDEMKIFDVALTPFEIEDIVANEATGRNYDGALRPCDCTEPELIDHYEIIHDQSMVSCLVEEITFTAHDDADLAVDAKDALLQISTSTSKGEWLSVVLGAGTLVDLGGGRATYQFPDNGETSVTLRFSYPDLATDPELVNFNVSDGVSSDKGAASHLEDRNISVSDSGLVFTVPDTESCKPSVEVLVSAVKKSDNSPSCESAVVGDKLVGFYSQYVAPTASSNASVLLMSSNGTDYPLALSAPGTQVSMSFNAQGQARMKVAYPDAGMVGLHASLEVGKKTLLGSDTFVMYPSTLHVVAEQPSGALLDNSNVSGGAVWAAANPFTLRVEGQCENGTVTANYQPSNAELGSVLQMPTVSVGGVGGALATVAGVLTLNDSLNWLNISTGFSAGVFEDSAAAYSEVGVIEVRARDADYYGHNLDEKIISVGRFVPGYLDVAANTPEWGTHCSSDIFSYMDEPIGYQTLPELSITAYNAVGGRVYNYGAGLWKLSAQRPRSYSDKSGAVSAIFASTINSGTDTWSGSEADYNGEGVNTLGRDSILYQRRGIEAPFEGLVDLTFTAAGLSDDDGVCYRDDTDGDGNWLEESCKDFTIDSISAKEIRFGRLNVVNAFGPETESISLPWRVEYYDGNRFVLNEMDSCSVWLESDVSYTDTDGVLFSSGLIGPAYAFSATDFRVNMGDAGVVLSAPGAGNRGVVNVTVDLNRVPYLKFDWNGIDDNGDGDSFDDDPNANIVFGQYRSNDKIIFQRQW